MKSKIFNYSKITTLIVAVLLIAGCVVCGCAAQKTVEKDIGIAWTTESNYGHIALAVEEAGGESTVLPEIKYKDFEYDGDDVTAKYKDEYGMLTFENAELIKARDYDKTNVAEVVSGHKAIVFPGGEDISPSLYKEPLPWYDYNDKPEFNVGRDISDYILMAYCLDNNIPVMGICRGMQMYNVVSGGTMIQDLPTYFKDQGVAYNNEHTTCGELDGKKLRGNHPVNIDDKHSLLYQIFQEDTLLLPYSSHHQAAYTVDQDHTKVTATASVNGVRTIEALERADGNAFGLFLQFHPEHSLAMWVNNTPGKERFMSYDESIKPFRYLVNL